jgi:hypothetical protein
MNILYIGDFNENNDSGRGSIERVASLRSAGAKVVTRHIGEGKITDNDKDIINEFECVIQSTYPYNMVYDSKFILNVSDFDYPLNNFKSANFKKYLNMMDLCLVSSEHSVKCYKDSGVIAPVFKSNFPSSRQRYLKETKCPNYIHNLLSKNHFIFYSIASGKNVFHLDQLIFAYYTEFSQKEKVSLVIKVDENNKELKNIVESQIKKINRDFDPDMLLVLQNYSDQDKINLHVYANCYIDTSYGNNWSYDAFDAMAFGNTPIVPNSTCFTEFINDSNGYVLNTDTEPCFNSDDIWGGTYRCNQHWSRPLVSSIKNTMRKVFENRQANEEKSLKGMSDALRFDTMELGGSLLEALNHAKKEKLERLH